MAGSSSDVGLSLSDAEGNAPWDCGVLLGVSSLRFGPSALLADPRGEAGVGLRVQIPWPADWWLNSFELGSASRPEPLQLAHRFNGEMPASLRCGEA